MSKKQKVFLLHGEISPYRLPLFEALSKEVDLEVFFCRTRSHRRKWSILIDRYSFKRIIGSGFNIGPFIISLDIVKTLFRRKYDIYILGEDHRIMFVKMLALAVAKLRGKPIILWSGMTEDGYYERVKRLATKFIINPLSRLYFHWADGFIAYGKATRRYLIKVGADPGCIFTGTQMLSGDQLTDYPVEQRTDKARPINAPVRIVYMGYFDKRKGADCLIDAYKSLDRRNTELILAGMGAEKSNLQLMAKGKNDIIFPGYVEGKDKYDLLSNADIFVFPTLSDAWGLVVNEAMMFGLPIISTDQAGCSEELVRGNGFVVKAGDVEQLAWALAQLLDHEDIRREMGKISREKIKSFTIDAAKDTFIAAISHVVKTAGISQGRTDQESLPK